MGGVGYGISEIYFMRIRYFSVDGMVGTRGRKTSFSLAGMAEEGVAVAVYWSGGWWLYPGCLVVRSWCFVSASLVLYTNCGVRQEGAVSLSLLGCYA